MVERAGVDPEAPDRLGPGFFNRLRHQEPPGTLADRIRNEARVPTIAVGSITEADQMNSIIAAGRADLCALGRPHLADPAWTLRAAAELGWAEQWWPRQYLAGKSQLEREVARKREMERAQR